MNRDSSIKRLQSNPNKCWDVIIIGGGATGLGTALEAASRGYEVLLLEQADFAKGTSSRSTKLVHGGVRYLAQGDVGLVREALKERGQLQQNAPHLVKNERFIIPSYHWWTKPYYTIGLSIYDWLAGKLSFGRSYAISKKKIIEHLPTIKQKELNGGIVYHDGQFDDARLAVNIAQTAVEQGAVTLNYMKVTSLLKKEDQVSGVQAKDLETNNIYNLQSKVVINATGVFVDDVMKMDKPTHKALVRPSQGVHIVLDASFLPSSDALMIPKTEDGRVLFAVPWHDKVVVGTTDTPIDQPDLEPRALDEEVDFILKTTAQYLSKVPTREDVLSVFAGLRPLAAPSKNDEKTKEISRSHKILVSNSGLITITGGKWTTFRKMGEDIINRAINIGGLAPSFSKTRNLSIHGSLQGVDFDDPLYFYGSDINVLKQLIEEDSSLSEAIIDDQPYIKAQVILAVRNEMARTVDDFLARRVRLLFLDARLAIQMAPVVATLMAQELNKPYSWIEKQTRDFTILANEYLLSEIKTEKSEVAS